MPAAAPAGAHLNYYGGRVVSSMQVVQVLWGTGGPGTGSGQFFGNVYATSSPSMATFYQGVLNSPYVDWLSEYDTFTSGGTKQSIARGGFVAQVAITPSHTGNPIDDTAIQAELAAQIIAGHLPAPTQDGAGNNNTYYAIFFPHGQQITQGGAGSCVSGGFCAYHGTVANVAGYGEVYYGVHPDMQSGSGCDTGCGSGTPFGNYTSVASHEMVETITDCEVGLATTNAAPLAWYDPTNGEIGDICNAQQGSVVGSDGVTYTVQTEFSNVANACIVSRAVADDFAISAAPSSLTITAGSSGAVTIATTAIGNAQTISLGATGLPAGVSASFSPTSVSAGGSSNLTIAVVPSAVNGTYGVTVTGAAASGSHAASITLVVTGGMDPPPGITNGDFETGDWTGWTTAGVASIVNSSHGGTFAAQIGGPSPSTDSSIAQSFVAPSTATQLSFWYQVHCPDTLTYDWASATLADDTAGTSATMLAKTCTNAGAWAQATAPVVGGHHYTLTLSNHDDNFSGDPTYTWYDDVAFDNVPPSDFTIAVSPASASIVQGAGGTITVSTGAINASETVSLSATGLPAGVTGSFSPAAFSSGGSSTLTLTAASSAAVGTATVTIVGVGASGGPHSATLSLTITAPPSDFTVAVSPATASIVQGSSGTATVSTGAINASEAVSLSVSGLPAGVTGSFSPASVASGSNSTLTLTAASSAAAGTSTVTVTGTAASGGPHSAVLSLTIAAPPSDFTIAVSPAAASVLQGASTAIAVGTSGTSGAAQAVSLSAAGVPAGTTVQFAPSTIVAGGKATMTMVVGPSTPRNIYAITITATGTAAVHKTYVLLTVY
jgi:hypothetical protein